MKLVLTEPESAALAHWIASRHERLASVLVAVEVRRSVRRAEVAASGAAAEDERELLLARTEAVLASLNLVALSDSIVSEAGALAPPGLRTLDAIHLATALHAGPLDGLVTYDARLHDAAAARGLAVFHPGS